MSLTARNFYHERKKKPISINLNTKLKNISITDKLRNYKSQNLCDIFQAPPMKSKEKMHSKQFSFFSFGKKKYSNLNNLFSIEDLNKTEIDLTNFNAKQILTESSLEETETNTYTTTEFSDFNENSYESNAFKLLLNSDYNSYTENLKKLYPSFKFNHYSEENKESLEYFKKFGEKDIINRNSKYNESKNIENEGEYISSNLLEILGISENFFEQTKNFKIPKKILEKNEIIEYEMLKNDFSIKTEIIDKELEHILKTQSNKFYNYIVDNSAFVKKIEEFSEKVKIKNIEQKLIKKKYLDNCMKLILKEKKKIELNKLLSICYKMNELRKNINKLKNLSGFHNENILIEVNKLTNNSKEIINHLKEKVYTKNDCKFLIKAENIINIYENQGKLDLIEKFNWNIKNIINSCLIYYKENNIDDYNEVIKETNYKLKIEKNSNFPFADNDFEFTNNNENIFIKYILFYNNLNDNKIYNSIVTILNLFELINQKNIDMSLIISIFQDIFKNVITNSLNQIENQTKNKLNIIKLLSNCYSVILSNYFYIIHLIENNFNVNKNTFVEVTELLQKETDKIIISNILSYLNEIFSNESFSKFLEIYNKIRKYSIIYFKLYKIDWNKITYDTYKNFIDEFKDTLTKDLMSEYNKNNNQNLLWDEVKNINNTYQQMFEKLYADESIDNIKPEQIKINLYNNNIDFNYIVFINEKNGHKISNFSYLFIKYCYIFLYVYISTYNIDLKKIIINQLYKVTKDLLLYTEDLIVNNPSGLIFGIKKITTKEIALYYSDLLVIEKCVHNFLNVYEDKDISELLHELKSQCFDSIEYSLQEINTEIINSFENQEEFSKDFIKYQKIYENLGNCFLPEDINEMFCNQFDNLFNELKELVKNNKESIKESGLDKFKKELNIIKRSFLLLNSVDCEKYNDNLEEIYAIVDN